MSRNPLSWVAFVVAAVLLVGCTSSYVDPKYKNQSLDELKRPQALERVRLEVEFQTNGSPSGWATKKVRALIAKILTESGTVTVVADDDTAPAATMRIVMNNVGDMGDAVGKGFGTGLTFGLVGSMVTDGYKFDATYIPAGSTNALTHQYEHAIYSTIGNKEGPPGLTPLPIMQAFDKVVTDLTTAFLKDLQLQGYLVQWHQEVDRALRMALFGQPQQVVF